MGRESVGVGCGSMAGRLDCHRSLSWDVLAHYQVCCLWMEAVSYLSINLSIHLPSQYRILSLHYSGNCSQRYRHIPRTERHSHLQRDSGTETGGEGNENEGKRGKTLCFACSGLGSGLKQATLQL